MERSIHISQFYAVSNVELAVELQYFVELGKYLHYHGTCLSIDGVDLAPVLRKSRYWDYFRIAVDNGWIIDCTADDVEITPINPIVYNKTLKNILITEDKVEYDSEDSKNRQLSMDYAYRTPLKQQVVFDVKTDQYWSWKMDADYMVNNMTLNSAGSESTWISFLAYVAVNRLLFGHPQNLLIEISYSLAKIPMVLSNFLLFIEETTACRGWCFYTYASNVSEQKINHLGYTAWYAKGVEMGELKHWYSPKDKLEYLRKLNLKCGDVIFLYERKPGQKLDYLKEIEGFHVAVIKDIDNRGIRLNVVNNKKTKEQGIVDYASYSMATKQMYNFNNPFLKANTNEITYSWSDIGVEYAMYDERYFITKCTNDDIREMYIGGGDWSRLHIHIPAIELTYWILKDFDIPFNDMRFVDMYMKEEPLYSMYHRTGTVDEKYIIK